MRSVPLHIRILSLGLMILFLFPSCELFFDEIGECINKVSPKLPAKLLVQGQKDVAYFESIQAEVKNADSDIFDYKFSLVSGSLPDGITMTSEGRLLLFSGTPSESGTFSFKLKVKIDAEIYGPGDGICFGKIYDKQDYKIVVLP